MTMFRPLELDGNQVAADIAHNPVMLDLYVSEDETDIDAQHSITSARTGNQTLDLAGQKEFAAEVDDVAASLWLAFARVAGSTDYLWRRSGVKQGA